MADPAFGAQAGVVRDDRRHQFLGMQAALHQGFGFAGAHQGHRFGRGIVAVLRRHQRQIGDIEAAAGRKRAQPSLGGDEGSGDQAEAMGLDRASQGDGIAGMHHRRRHRRLPSGHGHD